MSQKTSSQASSLQAKMKKRVEKKDDGRILIYYSFVDDQNAERKNPHKAEEPRP